MNLIETRELSETIIQSKTDDAFPRHETSIEINTQVLIQTKKSKIETCEYVAEAHNDKVVEESRYDDQGPLIDFEDSTIHDEKLDLDELKRKYGY